MKVTKQQLKQIIKEELELLLEENGLSRRGFLGKLGKGAAALGGAVAATKLGGGEALAAALPKDQVREITTLYSKIRQDMKKLAALVKKLPDVPFGHQGPRPFDTSVYIRLLASQGVEGTKGGYHGWRTVGQRINSILDAIEKK